MIGGFLIPRADGPPFVFFFAKDEHSQKLALQDVIPTDGQTHFEFGAEIANVRDERPAIPETSTVEQFAKVFAEVAGRGLYASGLWSLRTSTIATSL